LSTIETGRFPIARPQLAALSLLGSGLVAFAVFLSGFVIFEPAPCGLWALDAALGWV